MGLITRTLFAIFLTLFTFPLGIGLALLAQMQVSVVPGDRFGWDMVGPGLEAIKSYRYEVEVDGRRLTDPLSDVTCMIGKAPFPFECSAPIPISFGQHSLRVRSIDVSVPGLDAVEGAWSPMFAYVMRPVPAVPGKPRIIRRPGG